MAAARALRRAPALRTTAPARTPSDPLAPGERRLWARGEVSLSDHALDRLSERTALLPEQAVREIRSALRRGHVIPQARPFALLLGGDLRRYGVAFERRAALRRVVVMTVYDEELVAAETRETNRWRTLAGGPSACRDCGGALEVGGLACACAEVF